MPEEGPWANREYVLKAVKRSGGWKLENAAKSLRADREFMLEAVKIYGWVLRYAAKSLQADREVVLEAVRQDGGALRFADESLQADREVVLVAVRTSGSTVLEYAAKELHNDPEVKRIAERQG